MKPWMAAAAAVLSMLLPRAHAAEAEVRAALQKLSPATRVEAVAEVPGTGYYEAVVDGQILYVSADGASVFTGELWRVDGHRNLTAIRKNGLRREALAQLGAQQRIVFAAEHPKHTVTVFTDFDCGYCQRMHRDIAEYNQRGITVEYVLYPRGGLGSPSFAKAVSVWCAADRKQAFTLAKTGVEPTPASCENPLERNLALGARVGVTGTPMVYDAQGGVGGYLPPDQLLARLDAMR
jgi:thiol:disulfide interchange protein DsbC